MRLFRRPTVAEFLGTGVWAQTRDVVETKVALGFLTLVRPEHASVDHDCDFEAKQHRPCPSCPLITSADERVPRGWYIADRSPMEWGDGRLVWPGDNIGTFEV